MQKIIKTSTVLLGIVFLAGCGKQSTNQTQPVAPTPVVNQSANNQSDVTKQCRNFPSPSFCPGGVGDIIVTGTDNNGCSTYGCKPAQNWQVYKNEKYGYSIMYPDGWYSYVSDPTDVFFQKDKEVAGYIPGPHASALEVVVKSSKIKPSLLEIEESKCDRLKKVGGGSCSQEAVSIGGEPGMKLTTKCEGMGCGNPSWVVSKDGYSYLLRFGLGEPSMPGIHSEMVSTFKFTK